MEGSLVTPLGQSTPLVREPGWKATVHDLLFRPSSSPRARRLHLATCALIILSTACFVIESFASVHSWALWDVVDGIVCVLFTLEYSLRVYVAPYGRGDEVSSPAPPRTSSRWHVVRQPLSVIDLCAIAPFWIELFLSLFGSLIPIASLQLLRALRLVRVLRLLRFAEESQELRALADCVTRVLPALRLLVFFLTLELVIIGGLVFHAERGSLSSSGDAWLAAGEDQEDGELSQFQNIADAAWWTLVTVTTGDMYPITWPGRLVGAVAMLTGVVALSALVSIIGTEMAGIKKPERRVDPLTIARPSAARAPPLHQSEPVHENSSEVASRMLPSQVAATIREHSVALKLVLQQAQDVAPEQSAECVQVLRHAAVDSLEALVRLLE